MNNIHLPESEREIVESEVRFDHTIKPRKVVKVKVKKVKPVEEEVKGEVSKDKKPVAPPKTN